MDELLKPAFLGIESSLIGKRWRLRSEDDRTALALSQRMDVPEIVGRIMAGRGVGLDEAEHFLNPTLRSLLPDPASFKDMEKAAVRISDAIIADEKAAVFGDYDVDGATSSALLIRFFEAVGRTLGCYIPDRIKEGYGPNEGAMTKLKAKGVSLVITVDCGIVSFDALQHAHDIGLETVVVDHHQAETRLPVAHAVINPKRHDEDQKYEYLAAVGVTFLLIVAINRKLRDLGWYSDGRTEPQLMQWLDLVALGTICDVVPLTGLNRALVRQGLKVMAGRHNAGITALADVSGMDETPGTYHAGFLIGPRVNAGGRVGRSELGSDLLSTNDPQRAEALARELDEFNRERKEIEAGVTEQAMGLLEQMDLTDQAVVIVDGDGWHPGVIGIVASRIKEASGHPAFVIAWDGATGKGSGRSIAGVNLGAAVGAARHSGILTGGGGHGMAAGITIERERMADFSKFLNERLKSDVARAQSQASIGFDGALSVSGATADLIDVLDQVGPYGAGNPEPRFAFSNVRIIRADIVGENHVRCVISGAQNQGRLNGICFRCLDTPLGQALLHHNGRSFHIGGHLRINSWRGERRVQLLIEDAALQS